jgi:3-deoxy-manno-octulosonate cytidylyltransferase (CMP-KDO synthetase)
MKALAVIPARLGSTRLPRKVLRSVAGEPMLARVYRSVESSGITVIVATDSEEIMQLCRERGFAGRLTSFGHRSGTERVHEVAQAIEADVYVNVQGDEPLVRREHIVQLLELMSDPVVQVGTLRTVCTADDRDNPNAVKVVAGPDGRALYFSRATIPYDRDRAGAVVYKHLGLYAYRRSALAHFCSLPESPLERSERLEQLRFLEHGIPIHVGDTPFDTIGVDTEEDLRRVEELLAKK